ncbi:hypothetical protein GCM10025868_17980 [Angustibacter aerolatus]|uniref:LACTB2 winged helix domain-containing protein n=1 Tax=Angustibacter aerolatus TaxID=1162965 RepID=A0ABQ6JEF9_9ACTN|nr:hypothetical protein GCM10025868_17980 [Angustibacter aerolatus]
MLPGHGPVLPEALPVLDAYLAHREQRLEQVRAALAAGDTTPEQVVARVYADVPPDVQGAALQSVRAQARPPRRHLTLAHPSPVCAPQPARRGPTSGLTRGKG